MGPIGVPEMLFILAIALLIFGPKRLPEFGRTIGKALGEFRRATTDLKRTIDVEIAAEEPAAPKPKPPAARPVARASAPRDGAEEAGAATPTDEPAKAPAEEEPESPPGS